MKIGFITDSLCDLPSKFITKNNIHIIPTKIIDEDITYLDEKTPELTKKIYEMLELDNEFKTEESSILEVKHFINKILIENDYEAIMIITSDSSKNKTYFNCLEASMESRKESHKVRTKLGLDPNIPIEVIDSKQISVGVGALVTEAVRAANEYSNISDLSDHIKTYTSYIHTFFIPNNLHNLYFDDTNEDENEHISFSDYLYNTVNIKPVLLFSGEEIKVLNNYMGTAKCIRKVLETTIENINDKNLLEPNIHISYGGSINDFKNSKIYLQLNEISKQNQISVFKSNINASLATIVGPKSFAISFISKNANINLLNEDD